jgi:signal peptidase I
VLAPVAYLIFFTGGDVPTSGPSMRPTLTGEVPVKVDYDAYAHREPALGEIVVFQGPASRIDPCAAPFYRRQRSACPAPMREYGDEFLIKRVVGRPGDTIAVARDGRAIRNGRVAAQGSIRRCRPADLCALPRPVTVPPGHYFVMGDNRRNSLDSREFGAVPKEALDGRVVSP